MNREAQLRTEILYYPFMGTPVDTERLVLLSKICYSPLGVDDLQELLTGESVEPTETGRFIRGLIKSGHLGTLEHWYTTFAVEGYSRISSQQNDRHRLIKVLKEAGVAVWVSDGEQGSPDTSQLQQSQRYVAETDFRYVVPPSIRERPELYQRYLRQLAELQEFQRDARVAGVPAEDARFLLPNAVETRFVVTTNARQLRHMFNLRCCDRAQWEIRALFCDLLEKYQAIAPNLFWRAGASCVELGFCPEGSMSCGKAPTLSQLRKGL
ncbi:MAG: FAD-dependent thymidylate synthase [Bacillota bacterium]